MALSASVVLKRSHCESLEAVKKLNCWGCSLSDVSVLGSLPNLEVLNLSCNSVSSLSSLRQCQKLRELYIRKNNISGLQEVEKLISLANLQILWLSDNPVSREPGYRGKVIQMLPQLKKLDNKSVAEEERTVEVAPKGSNVLAAVFCLLPELDSRELEQVQRKIETLQNQKN